MRSLTICFMSFILATGLGAKATSAIAAPAAATPSGYTMVGGPNGSDFGQAEVVYSWDRAPQHYTNVGELKYALNSDTPGCPGYFAWFASPTLVTLPASGSKGETRICALSEGWNLVGNPFSLDAMLPPGVTAWYWNATTATYRKVSQIPTGGAAWIYRAGASNMTISAG